MATRNIVPRANNEGSLGTTMKKWSNIYAENGNIAGRNIATDGAVIDANSSNISSLQSRVTTLEHAYAGAQAASTVGSMTDTSRIYVYVGSEAGYTAGDWYYYNGSAWVSGGVYNATGLETDKTLTAANAAADAQITGIATEIAREIATNECVNVIPDFDSSWVDGYYFSPVTAEPVENDIYMYENEYINCWGFDKVIGSSGFCFLIFYDKNKTPIAGNQFSARGIAELAIPSTAAYMRFSWVKRYKNITSFVFLCTQSQYENLRVNTGKTNLPLTMGRQAIWGNSDSTVSIGEITDADDILTNSVYVVQGFPGTKISNLPDGFVNDGAPYLLKTFVYTAPIINSDTLFSVVQVFERAYSNTKCPYKFIRYASPYTVGFTKWVPQAGTVLECGANKMFTTLKEAISVAIRGKDVTVIVYPGTYDLNQEFADEIASATGIVGNKLTNNITLKFLAGSFVTVSFEPSNTWAYHNFNPFYSEGDYTIDGLNIYAKNSRYCIHDEMDGAGIYKHIYKDCVMEYENTVPNPNYVQCIGGGLGQNGFICIEGGYYKSTPTIPYTSMPTKSQQPITYHNGAPANIESKIFISGVHLADEGYFRFGWYGSSTLKSKVYINGCRMGYPTLVAAENSTATINNFDVLEWGNTVVNND